MKDTTEKKMGEVEQGPFPATVAYVVNDKTVVINRGSRHGVKLQQRFLIYSLSDEEIKDPESGQKLGYLEIVKGSGKVVHVQENMATIESDRKRPSERTIVRKKDSYPLSVLGIEVEERIIPSEEVVPFDEPEIGDKAKPI